MSDTEQCSPPGTQDVGETWVPYTAVSILFIVLVQSSVTSWTSHPAQVLAGIKLGEDEDSDPGLCICCRFGCKSLIVSYVTFIIPRPATRREPFPGPSSLPLAEQDGGQHMIRNERAQAVYSYSLFHITLCLANMYVTMQLTQWFQPQEATIISFSKSWSTVILKTVSTWLSVLVYLATLVIPVWRPPARGSMQAGSGQIPAGINFITIISELACSCYRN